MEDLLAKMQEILGSKEGQDQLKNVAQMLGGESGSLPDLSQLGSLLGGSGLGTEASTDQSAQNQNSGLPQIDMNMLLQVQQLMGTMNQEDDNTRLLMALKPYFRPERQTKVDQAVKMLHLLSLLPLLKESGLLGGLFGDGWKL